MKRGIVCVVITTAVLVADRPVIAHHSFAAQYDRNKPVTLTGPVTKLEWMNPHIYFYMDVKEPDGRSATGRSKGGRRTRCIAPDGVRTRSRLARSSRCTVSRTGRHQTGQHWRRRSSPTAAISSTAAGRTTTGTLDQGV